MSKGLATVGGGRGVSRAEGLCLGADQAEGTLKLPFREWTRLKEP